MSIRPEMLRPGDLIFYSPKPFWMVGSWLITWLQNIAGKSPIKDISYSHVGIVDYDTNYFLESRWPKSRRWKINWKKLNKCYKLELWRVKHITKKQQEATLSWCHNHLNEWYDLGLFVLGMFDIKQAEVCSTFVAKAFRAAGIYFKIHKKIGYVKDFASPDELISNTDIIKRIA